MEAFLVFSQRPTVRKTKGFLLFSLHNVDPEFTSICPFSVLVWHRGSLKGRMATAGLGRVGGYLEPLQGIHLEGAFKE